MNKVFVLSLFIFSLCLSQNSFATEQKIITTSLGLDVNMDEIDPNNIVYNEDGTYTIKYNDQISYTGTMNETGDYFTVNSRTIQVVQDGIGGDDPERAEMWGHINESASSYLGKDLRTLTTTYDEAGNEVKNVILHDDMGQSGNMGYSETVFNGATDFNNIQSYGYGDIDIVYKYEMENGTLREFSAYGGAAWIFDETGAVREFEIRDEDGLLLFAKYNSDGSPVDLSEYTQEEVNSMISALQNRGIDTSDISDPVEFIGQLAQDHWIHGNPAEGIPTGAAFMPGVQLLYGMLAINQNSTLETFNNLLAPLKNASNDPEYAQYILNVINNLGLPRGEMQSLLDMDPSEYEEKFPQIKEYLLGMKESLISSMFSSELDMINIKNKIDEQQNEIIKQQKEAKAITTEDKGYQCAARRYCTVAEANEATPDKDAKYSVKLTF